MKPSPRFSVFLRTLLVFSALLKISQAECVYELTCNNTEPEIITTSSVTFGSTPNCSASTGNQTNDSLITDLTPGKVHEISFNCFNCCRNVTTKPAKITNLAVNGTTTSSIYVMWSAPAGMTSFYRVQWTPGDNGATPVSETNINITGLMAGVQYEITVTAVAEDKHTEGENVTVSRYTRPGQIGEPTVSTNTSSISINWTAPPGEVFQYRVEWHNGGAPVDVNETDTSAVLTGLIPGTSYTITVTAFARDGQAGEPYKFTSVTNPAVVRNLTIAEITTSSVSLRWTEPEGNPSSYTIQWTTGRDIFNNTTTESSFTITNLTPGYQHNITVTAVASSKEGERISITTFTRPVKPEHIQVTAQGTDMLGIGWTLPEGGFDHYIVNISREEYSESITTKNATAHFTGLNPGRIYDVTVTAVVGSFGNTSDESQFATNPNPPGPIIISQRTNSSLHLKWDTPALMAGAISYHITYQSEGGGVFNHSASVNDTELNQLSSGTFYNITLRTVGPQNLTSTAVHNGAFTLPNSVLNLAARPKSTTCITVWWSYPQGVHSYYQYLVQIYNDTGPLFNLTVNNKSTDVPDLEPGTRYTINVTTLAAAESESTVEQTFTYTTPKAVTGLTVEGVNTTAVRLTWVRQSDHKPSYSYLVEALWNNIMVQNGSTQAETYTFIQLIPGELYTFEVSTVVEGFMSIVESKSSYTQPDTVSDITVVGNTTSLSVSWTSGTGHVDSFSVLLLRDSQLVENGTDLSNTTFNKLFHGLRPGVLYCVVVVTKSGGFETNSSVVCNATFPNPTGPIMVDSQTVESINFTWPLPEDMDHNQYKFGVSNHEGFILTANNWFLLTNLQSGSPYNITVVTIGERNYTSTAVTAENYTRPYNVTMLGQKEITTDSVTLVWKQLDSKPDYSYVVHVSNGSFSSSEDVLNTTHTITGLLSGSNYSFTVTTQTTDRTQAAPVTVSIFTRPYNVTQLKAETLNTTAIHLQWTEPLEYKSAYTYQVDATGCGTQNESVTTDFAQISGLTPGTNCTFCVFVRAADGTKGEEACTSQYTMPEPVYPSISSQGSNSSILVSWTKPPGGVESYKVFLDTTLKQVLSSSNTSYLFEDLSAGRLYTVMVITKSGPFNASSKSITNATFPNRPGPIVIDKKTTTSIDFRWQEAPLMASDSFQYLVTIGSPQKIVHIPASQTSHIFTNLLSGTSFTIFVATVGAMDLESEAQILVFTTRPFNVSNLSTSPKEESITVTWDRPLEHKDSYRYNVTWQTSTGDKSSLTGETEYDIQDLVPGSHYNLSVTTETSDGTQGAAKWISGCTNASQVQDLECIGPNKTNAEVILSWTSPNGQYSGFQVSVNNNEIINKTSTCCNHTVPNLRHFTDYILTVETLSCGLPSTGVVLKCKTGITDPPIPPTLLVETTTKEHDRFSIEIDSELLNNTNGPITHVGVLVTAKQLDNTADLRKYLGSTYSQWKADETVAYLATVIENDYSARSGKSPLIIGDETKWNGYTNGVLSQGTYHYAIALFTHLSLQNDLVNGSLSLVSVTAFIEVTLPMNPAVGIAVGASLGIFAVLFCVLIGFIIYWKRLSNKEAPDIQIHSMRAKVSVAVRVEDYEAYYKKQKADSNCGFAEEFEDLKIVGTGQSKTNALTLDNKPKNRYNNVLPYDSSRVKLSIIHGSPYDDYINANYMPGYNSRKEFIAAQGPLPATVNEFWRMIWEKNVQTLVMLTRCNEQGRVKCERYWDSGTKHFENITVTTTSEIPLEDWTIRDFDIKNVKTAETRSVRHFHFTAWPDHGVPETTELLISFRHLVREHMDQYSRNSPTVVHCSAGVGRTGTFIAIDRLIFQIERENIVDVYGIVHDLRMHRPLMVQTEDQYVFLNQCAMDIIRSRTGTNVDLIYQNTAALSIYENVEPKRGYPKNGYHNA